MDTVIGAGSDGADAPVQFERLAVLGCGLIGGSFALAARRAKLARHVVGYSKSPSTTRLAMQRGVIDEEADSALRAVNGADLVLLAVPVSSTADLLKQLRHGLEPHALVMDVGSTKGDVVLAVKAQLGARQSQFVPCHPIAGKEKSGVLHAEAGLFDGKRVVITPLAANSDSFVDIATQAWESIGGVVSVMTPAEHDAAFAAVSHLPHLLAFAYVQALTRQPKGGGYLQLAGPGFRDFTRIAASDAVMWRDVFQANGAEVLQQLQLFKQALAAFEAQLRQGNWTQLEALIRDASGSRQAWSAPSSADDTD
ncbi:T-protein [mine drainage metagenome]|uniref:T-protein n=1 Tax=mine drainage metagenome TaxID=410659 RepID=A0A1J5Q4H4_9ZZZZ